MLTPRMPLGAHEDDVVEAVGRRAVRRCGRCSAGRPAGRRRRPRGRRAWTSDDGAGQGDGGRALVERDVPRQACRVVAGVAGEVDRTVAESGEARGPSGGGGEVDGHAGLLCRGRPSWWARVFRDGRAVQIHRAAKVRFVRRPGASDPRHSPRQTWQRGAVRRSGACWVGGRRDDRHRTRPDARRLRPHPRRRAGGRRRPLRRRAALAPRRATRTTSPGSSGTSPASRTTRWHSWPTPRTPRGSATAGSTGSGCPTRPTRTAGA